MDTWPNSPAASPKSRTSTASAFTPASPSSSPPASPRELIDWLRGTRLTPIVVIHANHANELDDTTAAALARLTDSGIPLLNQSVLLRGINDTAAALINLSRRLVDLRVMPYYLHQLDRVRGAAHFEVPVCHGLSLIEEMRRDCPATPFRATCKKSLAKNTRSSWPEFAPSFLRPEARTTLARDFSPWFEWQKNLFARRRHDCCQGLQSLVREVRRNLT